MTTERFQVAAAAAAGLVLAVLAVAGLEMVPRETAATAVELAQVAAAALAAACCGRTGWRATGPERRWRLLVALGIGAWGLARAARTWAGLAGPPRLAGGGRRQPAPARRLRAARAGRLRHRGHPAAAAWSRGPR